MLRTYYSLVSNTSKKHVFLIYAIVILFDNFV